MNQRSNGHCAWIEPSNEFECTDEIDYMSSLFRGTILEKLLENVMYYDN